MQYKSIITFKRRRVAVSHNAFSEFLMICTRREGLGLSREPIDTAPDSDLDLDIKSLHDNNGDHATRSLCLSMIMQGFAMPTARCVSPTICDV